MHRSRSPSPLPIAGSRSRSPSPNPSRFTTFGSSPNSFSPGDFKFSPMYQFEEYKVLGTPRISTDNFDSFLSPAYPKYSRRSVDLSNSTLQVPSITAKPRPLSANLEDLWKKESVSTMFPDETSKNKSSKTSHRSSRSSKSKRSGRFISAMTKVDFNLKPDQLSESLRQNYAAIIIQRAWHDYCRRKNCTRGRRKSRSKSPIPRFLRYVKDKLKGESRKADIDDLGLYRIKTVDF